MKLKKVLIASYYFLPQSHPGVQRPLKFAKFLPAFGYQPMVLTCANVPWQAFDHETYKAEVQSGLIVQRVPAPNFKTIGRPVSIGTMAAKTLLKLETILFEDRMDWALGGRPEFVGLAADQGVALVYTTGPPHSVHFIGSFLKSRLNIPWIADFRDEMATHPPAVGRTPSARFFDEFKKKTLISFFEAMIIKKCDALVSVTDAITRGLKSRYPKYADKMVTITNGFDDDDFNGVEPHVPSSTRLNLVHTGRFWHHQTPEGFLSGLKHALAQAPKLREELAVTFVGPFDPCLNREIASGALNQVISAAGPVSHREAIAYQLGSDANLLILSHENKQGWSPIFSGKIFEYLRAGRPILAVVPDGPARALIEETHLGYLARPGNSEEVAGAIIRLHSDWKTGALKTIKPPHNVIDRFSRKNLTKMLAGLFDRCLFS